MWLHELFNRPFFQGMSQISLFPPTIQEGMAQKSADLQAQGMRPIAPMEDVWKQAGDQVNQAWAQVGKHMFKAMAQVEAQMTPEQQAQLRANRR